MTPAVHTQKVTFFIHAPEAHDVIHVDEVERTPSVPKLGAIVRYDSARTQP